ALLRIAAVCRGVTDRAVSPIARSARRSSRSSGRTMVTETSTSAISLTPVLLHLGRAVELDVRCQLDDLVLLPAAAAGQDVAEFGLGRHDDVGAAFDADGGRSHIRHG